MRRNRGLRVYIQALQFVSGLCDVDPMTLKKSDGTLAEGKLSSFACQCVFVLENIAKEWTFEFQADLAS
jgi:hypothetical protein